MPLQRAIYRVEANESVPAAWLSVLQRLDQAELLILGVPSDAGGGLVRGAKFGPEAIRRALLRRGSWVYRDPRILDVGDIATLPYFLDDALLSPDAIAAGRRAFHGDAALPVSPLSVLGAVLAILKQSAPKARWLVLGGDHSISGPVIKTVSHPGLGVVHLDAHPDLLEASHGVDMHFASWARRALAWVPPERFVQVGVRVSEKTKERWLEETGVSQYWACDVNSLGVPAVVAQIVARFAAAGVSEVYVSNDIDATDSSVVAATGTPAADGLVPSTVQAIVEGLSASFRIAGSDLVEVAPGCSRRAHEPGSTLEVAADYVEAQAAATIGRAPSSIDPAYFVDHRLWAEEER